MDDGLDIFDVEKCLRIGMFLQRKRLFIYYYFFFMETLMVGGGLGMYMILVI
jgi:hypothetical protein